MDLARALASVALLLCAGPAVAAFIDLNDRIESIPSYISEVYRCGHWQSGGTEGYYRVLYAEYYYGNSLLYVQWLKPESPPQLIHTLSIPEFNADDHIELTFDKPRCIESARGIRFSINALSGHDGKRRRFDLQIFHQPGKYRIRNATDRP
jgi:hypothetical protein